MTSFSKFFNDTIRNKTCQELYHPWTSSCHRAWLEVFCSIIPDVGKLILPFVLVPLFYRGRNTDTSSVKNIFEVFVKMLVNTFGSVMTAFYLMCFFNKILGKFYIPTVVVLPAIIMSPISFILSSPVRKTHSQAFFAFVLEAAIKNSKISVIKSIRRSKIMSTILFMFISGSIMYYLKKSNHSMYWFSQPTKSKTVDEKNDDKHKEYVDNPEFPGWEALSLNDKFCCDHSDLCDKHVFDGFMTNCKFGICIEIIKRVISSAGIIKSNPIGALRHIVINTNYKFVEFLVMYSVLYRLSNCYLNRKLGKETPKTSLLAGIVAGVAFSFAPNYYNFTYGIAVMVQLIWHAIGTDQTKNIPYLENIYNLPWSVLIYGLFGGLMVHIRLFKPHLLPKLAVKINDMISNGHLKRIAERINVLSKQIA